MKNYLNQGTEETIPGKTHVEQRSILCLIYLLIIPLTVKIINSLGRCLCRTFRKPLASEMVSYTEDKSHRVYPGGSTPANYPLYVEYPVYIAVFGVEAVLTFEVNSERIKEFYLALEEVNTIQKNMLTWPEYFYRVHSTFLEYGFQYKTKRVVYTNKQF